METCAISPGAASGSQDSVTAMEYINSQLQLESEAREIMPFAFDHCTKPLGPTRQTIFSCKTCLANPTSCPSELATTTCGAAAICYSCSISCHGNHELVELFSKRDVVCDCGTTKIQGFKCELRKVKGETPVKTNRYCHNYWGRFCACDEDYDPENAQGTMYQCLLGDACNEDWFHDKCILGETNAGKQEADSKLNESKPKGTESENGDDDDGDDDTLPGIPGPEYEGFICWRCLEKNPWLKRYAGTDNFCAPTVKKDASKEDTTVLEGDKNISKPNSEPKLSDETPTGAPLPTEPLAAAHQSPKKRKADVELSTSESAKKFRTPEPTSDSVSTDPKSFCTYKLLPPPPSADLTFSLFVTPDFRSSLCHCPTCFPNVSKHPIFLEPETTYEPPLDSESSHDDAGSVNSGGSLFDRGERALGMVDRVKAIEGVMAYNDLKEKVKAFLKPFAENGKAVGVDDVKKYFAELRGDVEANGDGGGKE
ncbi:hypothetical protein RUND412_000545 [Rhizina undulata]